MSARVKNMLSSLIQHGQQGHLKRSELEAFEDIWDKYHRYGRLTAPQQAWVEKVYFEQKLDRPASQRPPPTLQRPGPKKTPSGTFLGVQAQGKIPRIGYINHAGVTDTLMITNMAMLRELCPDIKPGSVQHQKISAFFRSGGEVLKIKPAGTALKGVA